jgi:hypothetical protein
MRSPSPNISSWSGTTSTRRKSLEHDRAGTLRLQRDPRGAGF